MMRSGCDVVCSCPLVSLRDIKPGRKSGGLFPGRKYLHANTYNNFVVQVKTFASRRNKKVKTGKTSRTRTLQSTTFPSKGLEDISGDTSEADTGNDTSTEEQSETSGESTPIPIATRSSVLQACIITSGLLLAFGALIRQASHIASIGGWEITDASSEVSFGFEMWHIELIVGLVVLITTSRYVLLETWPGFAESSQTANGQVLSTLQPLDYILVAFLPGISEELLFRGALLPLFGLSWENALVVGAVFGALHFGSGRKYSFAVCSCSHGISCTEQSSGGHPVVLYI
ncbi:uncharacterized protein LOC109830499 isoform X2 [Asparagus officinalis]|uniref:uncharacterized protein LOC109830499 isoform X2 n=1 Tax=Asparagus officinalis TaxID=4686 RepID=UPI00098E2281|nr:uncharacterized protein LOC109830499 isoform X2 [Asparagus officinalis]